MFNLIEFKFMDENWARENVESKFNFDPSQSSIYKLQK